jgi:uncharacterized Zn finger protein
MNSEQLVKREWWVQRWLELLDSYRFKKRLERARIYAREGNVLQIDFAGSQVLAKVQGSETEPYQVSLSLSLFSNEDWQYIIETLSQKAIFSAQLLAGEMPENIEQVFIANGLSLFPFTLSDITSRCSCPDKANPCKHIGAVYYQLADRFSEDPFVLFQLRGRTKEQILVALRQLRIEKIQAEETSQNETTNKSEIKEIKAASKSSKTPVLSSPNLETFWQYDEPLDSDLAVIVPPANSQTVLDILGNLPLAYEEAEAVKQYLTQVYQTVREQAMISALKNQ